jgi:hypothetical protein
MKTETLLILAALAYVALNSRSASAKAWINPSNPGPAPNTPAPSGMEWSVGMGGEWRLLPIGMQVYVD